MASAELTRAALEVWGEVCNEALTSTFDGIKHLMLTEAMCIRVGGAIEAAHAGSDLVPGKMYCAKCKFSLIRRVLYTGNGVMGAGGNETEPCPNRCGPLWPVTWEQEAREGYAVMEGLFDRAKAAEDALAAIRAAGPALVPKPGGSAEDQPHQVPHGSQEGARPEHQGAEKDGPADAGGARREGGPGADQHHQH